MQCFLFGLLTSAHSCNVKKPMVPVNTFSPRLRTRSSRSASLRQPEGEKTGGRIERHHVMAVNLISSLTFHVCSRLWLSDGEHLCKSSPGFHASHPPTALAWKRATFSFGSNSGPSEVRFGLPRSREDRPERAPRVQTRQNPQSHTNRNLPR